MITHSRLHERLHYAEDTGIFTWRPRFALPGDDPAKVATWNARYAGRAAGVETHGYIRLSVDDRKHYAHRLAWLYVYGEMPPLIDHINRDGRDNRISNLRIATKRQNVKNSDRRDNTSGHRGVRRSANGKRFIVQHKTPGRPCSYIGTFDTIDEAVAAYKAACESA